MASRSGPTKDPSSLLHAPSFSRRCVGAETCAPSAPSFVLQRLVARVEDAADLQDAALAEQQAAQLRRC